MNLTALDVAEFVAGFTTNDTFKDLIASIEEQAEAQNDATAFEVIKLLKQGYKNWTGVDFEF